MLIPNVVHFAFQIYTLMILLRMIASWIPELSQYSFMYHIYVYTEPYLGFFRRIIPPLGMFDFSPLIALFSLHLLEKIVLGLLFL